MLMQKPIQILPLTLLKEATIHFCLFGESLFSNTYMYIYIFIHVYIYTIELNQKLSDLCIYYTLCVCTQIYNIVRIERRRKPPTLIKSYAQAC